MVDSKRRGGKRQGSESGTPVLDISSLLAAFTEDQVERITGLTKARLRYWAKTDFFRPSYVEERQNIPFSRFYSFKDIVALRTLELLRVQNSVPLQQLRKVAEKLSHLKDRLWTSSTLFVVNRKVVIINEESGHSPVEVVSGQYLLGIPLDKIIRDTSAEIVQFTNRKADTVGRITRSKGIIRNALVVAGTRVPVAAILRLNEDGYTAEQIMAEYPDLTPADVEAALATRSTKAA